MSDQNRNDPISIQLWQSKRTVTADTHLELVLGSAHNLPLKYWKSNSFFFDAKDQELHRLTDGAFPKKLAARKSHPVFALYSLPNGIGFKVCPCSSKKPFDCSEFRFIAKDCRLEHTGYKMDRNSYLVESVEFNIPRSLAYKLWFKGLVPASCLKHGTRKYRKPRPVGHTRCT